MTVELRPYYTKNDKPFFTITTTRSKILEDSCSEYKKGSSELHMLFMEWSIYNKTHRGFFYTEFLFKTLIEKMGVSESTIRRRLTQLSEDGMCVIELIKDSKYKSHYRAIPTTKGIELYEKSKNKEKILEEKSDNNFCQSDSANNYNIYNTGFNDDLNGDEEAIETVETSKKDFVEEQPMAKQEQQVKSDSSGDPISVQKACIEMTKEVIETWESKPEGIKWESVGKAGERIVNLLGSVSRFKEYLEEIGRNDYLQGRKSNANGTYFDIEIGFVLSDKTLFKYLNKQDYFIVYDNKKCYDSSYKNSKNEEEMARKKEPLVKQPEVTLDQVKNFSKSIKDLQVKTRLLDILSSDTFNSWIINSDFEAVDVIDGEPVFKTKSKFYEDKLKQNYGEELKLAFGV